jgi:ketosteroid isomerase-like protein
MSWYSLLIASLMTGSMLTLNACTQAPAPAASVADTRIADEASIRNAVEKFKNAIGGHDLDTIASFYADDGWQLAENGPIARTAADRRNYWQQIDALPIASDIVDVADRIEVARSGDVAVQYGEFRQILSDKTGATRSVPQKFITAWRKQPDGSWKVSASMTTVRN